MPGAPTITLDTPRLKLILKTPEETRQAIDAMDEYSRAQVSAEWLARLNAATGPDPFVLSFSIVRRDSGAVIGQCGFAGPPAAGAVEIAYGVSKDAEGNGFATEAARALRDYALTFAQVKTVFAHTLPSGIASQRILLKCGFKHVGDLIHPQDGTVSRFEYTGAP
jgi:RimJ/RimL family protein N-acetyltransferase